MKFEKKYLARNFHHVAAVFMTTTHYVGAVLTTKDYLVNTNTVHNLQLGVLIVGFLLRTGQKFNKSLGICLMIFLKFLTRAK